VAKQLFSAGSEQASQERLLRVEEGSFEWAKMVLSLSDHATKDEARVAYRQLVFKHHPDRQSPENASQATKITADLNRAYDIILRHLDRMHH
jgi:DnaJ-class molecular chaperone